MILSSPFPDYEAPENISLPDYIKEKALQYGDRPAFIDGITGRSISYTQFFEYVARASAALSRMGLQQNDRVFIFAPNCLEYPILLHAVTSLGAILTTCNPIYTKAEISYQIKITQPKFVVAFDAALQNIEEVARKFDCVQDIIVIGKPQPNCIHFDDLLLRSNETQITRKSFDPKEQVCIIPFSSGTTGAPKGVLLTHHNMIHLVEAARLEEAEGTTPGKETFITFLPFYHGYGIGVFLLYAISMGVTNVVFPNFHFETVLSAVQQYKATFLHIVPPIAVKLIMDPAVKKYDISSVHTIICGAAPLDRKQAQDLVTKLGVKSVRQGYGMTELSVIATLDPPGRWKHGSAGVVLPKMKAKIVDVATGAILGPNQTGELCFKGPGVMKGYLNNPKATQETIDNEGWLHTGDIGYCDEEGHIFVVDRLKELIKFKGLQVAPAELESHLLKHPDIADAAVIGVPDQRAGELPRAYIVVKPGRKMQPQQVHGYLHDKVAPYKRLRGGVLFRNIIPKSASGKILRRELKTELANERKSKL